MPALKQLFVLCRVLPLVVAPALILAAPGEIKLATLAPAVRASRLYPAESLRYE